MTHAGIPLWRYAELMDTVTSAQTFERETIGCAVCVRSDTAQRDEFKSCLIHAVPSARECLLFTKLLHLFVIVCVCVFKCIKCFKK